MIRLALAALVALTRVLAAQEPAKPESPPGLYMQVIGAGGAVELTGVDERVSGVWLDGQSPHPSIAADKFKVRWRALLQVPRSATYRFSIIVRGRATLALGGKTIIAQEAADAHSASGVDAVTLVSEPAALEPGPIALEAQFEKSAADARVQLCWESEDFARVPIPASAFRLPALDDKQQSALDAGVAYELGKLAFENQRCGACHSRSDATSPLPSPDLTRIGSRTQEQWIFRWLEEPRAFRPGTEMPSLFATGAASAADRADVARYLASLGRDRKAPVRSKRSGGAHEPNAGQGHDLFAQRGCVACHDAPGFAVEGDHENRREVVRLGALGSKYTIDALANFIFDPSDHPAKTMPAFQLTHEDSLDLAAFLAAGKDASFEAELPAAASAEASLAHGKQLVAEKGCLNCHSIDGVPKVGAPAPSLERGVAPDKFAAIPCLALDSPPAKSPRYAASAETGAVLGFLSSPAKAKESAADAYEAQRTVERFRCLACHVRDGRGGAVRDRQVALMTGDKAGLLEQVGPPDLSGVGGKLRPEWLMKLFNEKTRARPWMQIRMPHFGSPLVAKLAAGFAMMDGEELAAAAPEAKDDPKVGLVGRDLVGKSGFACTACHDLAGAEAKVAFVDSRGPDLTLAPDRVRWNWFRSWLIDPQALVLGTKMPTFFPNGKSMLAGRHGLDTEQQIRAIYDYLSLGKKAPLPEGLRGSGGFSYIPEERPEYQRTPFDDAPRSVALGFPGGVSLQYDAGAAMVRRFWLGGFLRMDGTQWTGDHGPYPHPEGRDLWLSNGRFPIAFAHPQGQGAGQAADATARFDGYTLAGNNLTFHSSIRIGANDPVHVDEKFVGAPDGAGARIDRTMKLRGVPAGYDVQMFIFNAKAGGAGADPLVTVTEDAGSPTVRATLTASALGLVASIEGLPPGSGGLAFEQNYGFHVRAADHPRDLEITIRYAFHTELKPGAVQEPWAGLKTASDPLSKAPLTQWFHEGEHPEGDDPFAEEKKHYEIEKLPVPKGIVLQGGGCDFLPNGSIAICTRRGEVWIVDDVTKEPSQHKWHRFARGLHEPLGLKVVNGAMYVLQKPELTKLEDKNGDGEADEFTTVSGDWGMSTNFHEFAFGLETDKDGGFLGTLGLAIKPGGATREAQEFARGSAWKIHPDGRFEVLALGLRTPNGTGVDPQGRFYYADNQGDYIPACKVQIVRKGEFYGQRFALPDREAKVEYTPATVWLPYGRVSHSASDILYLDRSGSFGPFDGQLLVGDFTNSLLARVQIETVNGKEQGACWIFRGGFGSGLERFCFGPDGRLYCVETTGGWGAVGSSLYAFERLRYTGDAPFEMLGCHQVKDGFEITFTKPLDAAVEAKPALASVEQFHYHYWATYGSPEIDREPVKVRGVELSPDRTKLTILTDGLKTDRIIEMKLRNVTAAGGEKLVHNEVWYTLNEAVK